MGAPTSPQLGSGAAAPVQVSAGSGNVMPVEVLNTPNVASVLGATPEVQSNAATAFWNNVAAGAGAFSTAVQNLTGTYGKARITATSSIANTMTVQVSYDNITWYDLTQDNAGTLFTLALVAGHLSASRDLPGPLPPYIRLVNVTAATVTAGIMEYGL